jgi:hypothetical protein
MPNVKVQINSKVQISNRGTKIQDFEILTFEIHLAFGSWYLTFRSKRSLAFHLIILIRIQRTGPALRIDD